MLNGPVTATLRLVTFDPVGTGEIAERLGVEHQTVRAWKARGLVPEPESTLGGRPVWRWSTIERWARKTGRWPKT